MNHMNQPHRPFVAYPDWQQDALCRTIDSSVFFPSAGEHGADMHAREKEAQAVCRRCPVIDACAWTALISAEPHGVWGGMSEAERRRLRQLLPCEVVAAESDRRNSEKAPNPLSVHYSDRLKAPEFHL